MAKDLNFLPNYKIIQKIGEGSFSQVLNVEHAYTKTRYAAKILDKIYETKEEAINCPEVKTISRLEFHPNVIGMVDLIADNFPGRITLILDLMDMSLYEYIRKRKTCLPETKVKIFMNQLVCGLQHLHANGIFHRDIKPENILVQKHSERFYNGKKVELLRLADLGSVCSIFEKPPHTAYISTRWYRSPECLLTSGYYGSKMDIWSLGCVFYELLTLLPLFPGGSEIDQLHKIHDVLGAPSQTVLEKFKHLKLKLNFPKKKPIGLHNLVTMLSEQGFDVLKKTLAYHPLQRIDASRLMKHNYFKDVKFLKTNFGGFASTPSLITKGSQKSVNLSSSQHWNVKCQSRQSRGAAEKNSIIKLRERCWGMNSCQKKRTLLQKSSSSECFMLD